MLDARKFVVYAGQMVRACSAEEFIVKISLSAFGLKPAASRGFLRIPILCDRPRNDPASLSAAQGCSRRVSLNIN